MKRLILLFSLLAGGAFAQPLSPIIPSAGVPIGGCSNTQLAWDFVHQQLYGCGPSGWTLVGTLQTYPGAGIGNSTGSAWGTSYTPNSLIIAGMNFTGGGSSNAYTGCPTAVPTSLTGLVVLMAATFSNTASASLNLCGLGAGTIFKQGSGATLASGDITTPMNVMLSWDGVGWQMLSQIANPPTGTGTAIADGTQTANACETGNGTVHVKTPSVNCTIDSSGNVGANSVATGGASVPSLPTGANSCQFMWNAALTFWDGICSPTTLSQNLALLFPNTVPTANAILVYPAPTSNASTGQWSAFDAHFVIAAGANGIAPTAAMQMSALGYIFGDKVTGSALTTSEVGYITVPFACTIVGWHIMVDAGTATVSTWRVNGGTALPTSGNSISTAGVAISTGTKIDSTTVTDFTSTAIAKNDTLIFSLTAVATAKQLTFQLDCQK